MSMYYYGEEYKTRYKDRWKDRYIARIEAKKELAEDQEKNEYFEKLSFKDKIVFKIKEYLLFLIRYILGGILLFIIVYIFPIFITKLLQLLDFISTI